MLTAGCVAWAGSITLESYSKKGDRKPKSRLALAATSIVKDSSQGDLFFEVHALQGRNWEVTPRSGLRTY